MIGSYSTSTASSSAVHVGSGNATVRRPSLPDIAGIFGSAFQKTIKAGLNWYQGVIDTGKALQGASVSASRIEGAEMEQNERFRRQMERQRQQQQEDEDKRGINMYANGMQGGYG